MKPARSLTRAGAGFSLLLWAALSPSLAEGGNFPRFRPLAIERLYENRLRFTNREPMISVGLMEGQTSVRVSGAEPLRLMFVEEGTPKTLYAPERTAFVIKRLSGRTAELRHWVVVYEGRSREAALAELERWKSRDRSAQLFEVGTLNVLRGRVLNTRAWQVSVGGARDRRAAERRLGELRRKEPGLQLFMREELRSLPSGSIGIFDERGQLLHRATDSLYVGTVADGKVDVAAVEFGKGYRWHGREDRSYRGHIYVTFDPNGLLAVINSIGAESLLRGLVPAELFPSAPIEALKAQAVTARGEIFSKLARRHFGDPFHLCAEQHCQVYAGAKQEHGATDKAIAQTRGLLAVRPRSKADDPLEIVDTFYSSSCGGFSESNDVVWGTPRSPSLEPRLDSIFQGDPALARFRDGLDDTNLRAFLDSYPPTECSRSSFTKEGKYRWKRAFTKEELSAIGKSLDIGEIRGIEVLGRGKGGRVTGLRLNGTEGEREVLRELPVRRLFQNLNSGLFVVDLDRAADGTLLSATFVGGGWGHGVGMCQVGAVGRAERGQGFEQILGHYYNGAKVEPIY